MSNLDWVALPVALLAYFYEFSIAARWTEGKARMEYKGWQRILGGFLAFPGGTFQPLLFVMEALASVAIFLFWRNNFTSSSSINFDLVMGFTVANVFFLKLWTPSMLWGPKWWGVAAADSFFVMATGLAVLVIMGIESAWLPFGLYVIYPVLAFVLMLVSLYFWWNNEKVITALERYAGGKRVTYLGEATIETNPFYVDSQGVTVTRRYKQQPRRARRSRFQ